MFDLGWSEIFLIMVVGVLVVGPEEIPVVMRQLGRVVKRLQYIRYAMTQQFEDIMKDSGLDDMRKQVNFEEQIKNADFDEKSADEEEAA